MLEQRFCYLYFVFQDYCEKLHLFFEKKKKYFKRLLKLTRLSVDAKYCVEYTCIYSCFSVFIHRISRERGFRSFFKKVFTTAFKIVLEAEINVGCMICCVTEKWRDNIWKIWEFTNGIPLINVLGIINNTNTYISYLEKSYRYKEHFFIIEIYNSY